MRAGASGPFASKRRVALIAGIVVFVIVLLSLRQIARFWTDWLFFDAIGFGSVFTGMLWSRITLFLIFTGAFFAVLYGNLVLAERLAPTYRPPGPEEELVMRYHEVVGHRTNLVRAGISGVFALIAGAGVSAQWQQWLLFRNRVDFGISDPQFNRDVGFYVFDLPFKTFVVSWGFASMIIILLVTSVMHYLNGSIRLQTPGDRVTPVVKAHLSVLLGVLAAVKAVDYYYQRFELTTSTRGAVDGASFTDINAQLPAINLLLLISLLAVVLLLVNIRRRGWVLPALAVGLWAFVAVVVGNIYPAAVQQFSVNPDERAKEAEFIAYNIEATREAFAISSVESQKYGGDGALTAATLLDPANAATLRNARILDPSVVGENFEQFQGEREFYTFDDGLDVDRYEIDGEVQHVVLSTRGLNPNELSSWVSGHVQFTHGYGVAVATVNNFDDDEPDFIVSGVPLDEGSALELDRPQLYYTDGLTGYAVVGAETDEVDYVDPRGGDVVSRYDGEGGVGMGSFFRRAAFALRFGEFEPLFSGQVTSESKVLFNRDIRSRVETVAPFISWDADPYPVVADGRVVYLLDGYTHSDRYPYSQRANVSDLSSDSGLRTNLNYVRNSVKAVVDTYDGTVELYLTPAEDPIIEAWDSAFPDLFRPYEQLPDALLDHVRYPEDLFRVQTNHFGRYKITDEGEFFDRASEWSVSPDPGTGEGEAVTRTAIDPVTGLRVNLAEERINPTYQFLRLPESDTEEFVISRAFVPRSDDDSRQELEGVMYGSTNADEFGQLLVLEFEDEVDGPALAEKTIQNIQEISEDQSLLDQGESDALFGEFQLIPLGDSVIYARPFYVRATGAGAPAALTNVIVVVGTNIGYEPTFQGALEEATGVDLRAVFGEVADAPTDDGINTSDGSAAEIDPANADTVRDALAAIADLERLKAEALAEDPIDWEAFAEAQTEIDRRLGDLASAFEVPASEPDPVETVATTTTVTS